MTSAVPKKMDVPMGGTLTPGDTSQAKLGSTQESGSEELLIPNESQFVVHGREGRYLMEKSKWPKLMLASETNAPDSEGVEVLTQEETLVSQAASQGGSEPTLDPPGCQNLHLNKETFGLSSQVDCSVIDPCEEDLMDTLSAQSKGTDQEEEGQGWQAPKSKRAKKSKKRQVVGATRTSARVPRDGIPIATKAINRAMARNDISGTNQNSFTVLNSIPNPVLYAVMVDLDLVTENPEEQLDAFKSEEMARAKIAKASYRIF